MFNPLPTSGLLAYFGVVMGGINMPIVLCLAALTITTIVLYRRERYISRLEGDVNALTRYAETVSRETDRHLHEYIDNHLHEYRQPGDDLVDATRRCIDAYWTNGSRHYEHLATND